jgi:hypothetical protein
MYNTRIAALGAALIILGLSAMERPVMGLTVDRSWGVPANGFIDGFEGGALAELSQDSFAITTTQAIQGGASLGCAANGTAHYPAAFLRSITDSVESGWTRISQGAVSALIIPDAYETQAGIGFVSAEDGSGVFGVLKVQDRRLAIVQRRIGAGGAVIDSTVKEEPVSLSEGYTYKLEVSWSPFANTCIANVYSGSSLEMSLVGLAYAPDARHPGLICKNGKARFDEFSFDPKLDNWNYDWEFYGQRILDPADGTNGASNFANAAHWYWPADKRYYMHMRNGWIYSSANLLSWTKEGYDPHLLGSDPAIVMDPFGDGCVYISSKYKKSSTDEKLNATGWWRSNGGDKFVTWDTVTTMGANRHGLHGALQEIIDTKNYPRLDSVAFDGKKYRFIGLGELTFAPFSTVILSNDLQTWVYPDTINPLPQRLPGDWEQQGDAIGCGYPMVNGDILIISCTCTNAGYTGGGFEATGVSAILDGRQPWITRKVSRLPMTPALPGPSWLKGPNMPNSFVYNTDEDALYFFGDFGDAQQGLLRVRNWSRQPAQTEIASVRRQCEEYDAMSGVAPETCQDSGAGSDVGGAQNGDWMRYDKFNFGSDAAAIDLRLASNNSGGTIELRLDSIKGPRIGSYVVNATGGWQSWITAKINLSGASGIHDLFFVFSKSDAKAVANLNWFDYPYVDTTTMVGPEHSARAALPQVKLTAAWQGRQLAVSWSGFAGGQATELAVLDLRGRVVLRQRLTDQTTALVPAAVLPRGTLLLSVRSGGRELVRKITAIAR